MKLKKYSILALTAAFIFASCSEKDDSAETTSINNNDSLTKLVLTDKPADAINITSLRATAKPGDKVTFAGDILGSHSVFMDGRAIMVLGDPEKLTACSLRPGDECVTPWDVCCDDPDVIKASIVTVQAVDEAGKPLKEGFKGVGGMKELSSLIVTGEVAKGSTESNLLINATGVFVKK